jgi:hypothetical protein
MLRLPSLRRGHPYTSLGRKALLELATADRRFRRATAESPVPSVA